MDDGWPCTVNGVCSRAAYIPFPFLPPTAVSGTYLVWKLDFRPRSRCLGIVKEIGEDGSI